MLRLFVPGALAVGERLRIAGADLRHLRAWRLGPGAALLVVDAEGTEHEVRLETRAGRAADAVVVGSRRIARESPLDLTLAPALLKGTKMDLVVEKATELGVRRIAPVRSRHAIAGAARVERWRRLALAAAKQSGRTSVPAVDAPVALAALVRTPWPGLRVLAWEGERERGLADLPPTAAAVVIAIGPEGGFADDEVVDARAHGFTTVTLAPRILRGETAAIAAATLCQQRWGDLGARLS